MASIPSGEVKLSFGEGIDPIGKAQIELFVVQNLSGHVQNLDATPCETQRVGHFVFTALPRRSATSRHDDSASGFVCRSSNR